MAPWKRGLGNGQGRGRPFFYELAEEAATNPDAKQCYAKKLFEEAPIQDDVYKGWLIPEGTWVQGNVWAIHHHEQKLPDPDRFNPDRYIKDSPDARPFPGEKGYMTFGWDRRVCSGQGLAEQGTFITIARLLWDFKIEKALGEQGSDPRGYL